MIPAATNPTPTTSMSGRSLAVAGALAALRGDTIGGGGVGTRASAAGDRPRALATNTVVVSPGISTESDVTVVRGGSPAAESTQRFMLAMRAAVALSAFALSFAACRLEAESVALAFGGTNVAN
jgi:hypothetical protein